MPSKLHRDAVADAPRSVLFLDFDGVINVFGDHGRTADSLVNLYALVRRTDCAIVVSSSWRLGVSLAEVESAARERLGYAGPPFIGATPDLRGQPRGLEIAAWLAEQPRAPRSWAVVDDDHDMDHVLDRWVQTNPRIGLDETARDQLTHILNEKPWT